MSNQQRTPQTVVITGASSGIGHACAEIYAKNGFQVILGARRLHLMKDFCELLISRYAANVSCMKLDVRDEGSVQEFLAEVQKKSNSPDILINNAGLALGRDPVVDARDSDWNTMVETNFLGLLRTVRAFLPLMLAKRSGHIVNMGSIAGFQSYGGGAAYAGTKHAVRAVSQALREELFGTGIRVSEIDPGMVETEFSIVRFGGDRNQAERVYEGMTPLTPTDIAETVFFTTSRPPHVNIDTVVIQPTDQISASKVFRRN